MRLAFIGLGAMGGPMAQRLATVPGIDLTLFDLDSARLRAAEDLGRTADSVATAIADADVVCTVLPADAHVLAVVDEVVAHGHDGQVFVDFSTIGPDTILAARDTLAEVGITVVGMALSRSTAAAQAGELVLFGGGLAQVRGLLDDALDAMSVDVRDVGGIDTAKAIKLANNMVIACIDVAICEAIVLGSARGIPPDDVVDGLGRLGADSWALRSHIERYVLPDELGPGRFSTRYMAKDVRLYTHMATESGVASWLATVATTQYRGVVAFGLGDHYHMIVLRWQEAAAALDRRPDVTTTPEQRDQDLATLAGGIAAVQTLATEDALAVVTATGLDRHATAEHLQGGSAGNDHLRGLLDNGSPSLDHATRARLVADLRAASQLAESMHVPSQMVEVGLRDALSRSWAAADPRPTTAS